MTRSGFRVQGRDREALRKAKNKQNTKSKNPKDTIRCTIICVLKSSKQLSSGVQSAHRKLRFQAVKQGAMEQCILQLLASMCQAFMCLSHCAVRLASRSPSKSARSPAIMCSNRPFSSAPHAPRRLQIHAWMHHHTSCLQPLESSLLVSALSHPFEASRSFSQLSAVADFEPCRATTSTTTSWNPKDSEWEVSSFKLFVGVVRTTTRNRSSRRRFSRSLASSRDRAIK